MGRPISTILEEWRSLERDLDRCVTAEERIALDRRIAKLQDEHRLASETAGGPASSAPDGSFANIQLES